MISSEELQFVARASEQGDTSLSVNAQIIWTVPRSAAKHIPAGIAAITVRATASEPSPVSVSQTITEPANIQKVIEQIEGLVPPGETAGSCPADFLGALVLELGFLRAGESEPVATLAVKTGGCGSVSLSAHGQVEGQLAGALTVADLIENALATKL